MDIRKAQRLSQYLSVISDMVQYKDIADHMVRNGMVSAQEHELFQRQVEVKGNSDVMNELLTMVNLRRGGFDNFLKVLRSTDYEWVAEQLDPGKMLTEPSCDTNEKKTAKIHHVITNVRQTFNRKSEPIMSDIRKSHEDDFMFMSYRASCPIDIPIKPSYYLDLDLKRGSAEIESKPVDHHYESQTYENLADSTEFEFMNLELNCNAPNSDTALVENVPRSLTSNFSTTEYFAQLAKQLNVQSDLKAIRCGKIAKNGKKKSKGSNVKLEFHSEIARDHFINVFKDYTSNLAPSDEQYNTVAQLKISVPKTRSLRVFRKPWLMKRGKHSRTNANSSVANTCHKHHHPQTELETSKSNHWYQRHFSLKSWKRKKE